MRKELAKIQTKVDLMAITVNGERTVEGLARQVSLLAQHLSELIKLIDNLYVQTHKD